MVTEHDQVVCFGTEFEREEFADTPQQPVYDFVLQQAGKLQAGESMADITHGAYFFSRIKNDFETQPWAIGKIKTVGQGEGIYLWAWK